MRRVPLLIFGALVVAACGGDPKEASAPAEPTATATATVPPAPSPTAVPEPPPTASASAAKPPPPKPSSGRPAVIKSDANEVTDTFGSSPGAKIEIGGAAIFKIPEGALRQGTNITFKIDTKGKSGGAQVGKIYHVIPAIPPSSTPVAVDSEGPPFEIALPAGAKKDANLAIGVIQTDDKGREKIVWRIIAPKRIDDASNTAFFELMKLEDAFLHITTKPPTK